MVRVKVRVMVRVRSGQMSGRTNVLHYGIVRPSSDGRGMDERKKDRLIAIRYGEVEECRTSRT